MKYDEINAKADSRKLVIDLDTNAPVSIEDQADLLKEDLGTGREWCAIGVEDADGFAEVVALAHENNARKLAYCFNHFDKAIEALETIADVADNEWSDTEQVVDLLNDIRGTAQDTLEEIKGLANDEEVIWVTIPDDQVVTVWKCEEEDCPHNDECCYSPKWHDENGTPSCHCGVDMKYQRTEIRR